MLTHSTCLIYAATLSSSFALVRVSALTQKVRFADQTPSVIASFQETITQNPALPPTHPLPPALSDSFLSPAKASHSWWVSQDPEIGHFSCPFFFCLCVTHLGYMLCTLQAIHRQWATVITRENEETLPNLMYISKYRGFNQDNLCDIASFCNQASAVLSCKHSVI